MRHICRERERLDELRTPIGQAAYAYYGEWLRLQRRSVPKPEAFMRSAQYQHLLRFARWVDTTAVPNPNQFIKLMVETGTLPALWCRSQTYEMYLQWYDGVYPPEEQFLETYDRLVTMASDLKVPLAEVYGAIGPNELARLVRRRRLSPWLLVVSPRFLTWVQTLDHTARDVLNDAISFSAYASKLRQRPELARELRRACEAEGI